MVERAPGARRLRRFLIALAALVPAAAHAQSPEYRRAAGDTLRFREVTVATSEIAAPTGTMNIRSEHDATIAVTFTRGDTARAWFQALTLRARYPGGESTPATAGLLGQPYVLTLGARGDVRTLSVPAFSREIAEASDLTHEFNDFFVRLPAVALLPGVEWTDTTSRETRNAAGRTLVTTRIGRYRVRGDTTIGGVRGVAVEARTQNRLESSGPSPTPGMRMSTLQEGTETGTFVFSPGEGRLLARRREGSSAGHIEFIGGPQPMRLPQKMTYESAIERVR